MCPWNRTDALKITNKVKEMWKLPPSVFAGAHKTCILQSITMIRNQDSFHDLEEILRSLQEYSGDKVPPTDDSSKELEKHFVGSNSKEVSTAERSDKLNAVDILMKILLQQKLHTSKEYTLDGLRFKVYVLDDTELWLFCTF